jgi:hypothetical protein
LVCIHQISDKKRNCLEEHHIEACNVINKEDVTEIARAEFKQMEEINYA